MIPWARRGGIVTSTFHWNARLPRPSFHPADAALLTIRPAGACTAIVRGIGNTVGIALAEVCQVP